MTPGVTVPRARILALALTPRALAALEAHEVTSVETLAEARAVLASRPIDLVVGRARLEDGRVTELRAPGAGWSLIALTRSHEEELELRATADHRDDFLVEVPEAGHLAVLPLRVESALRRRALETQGEVERLEHAVKASEERWRTLFRVLPVGAAIVSAGDVVVDANPALERIVQLTLEDLRRGEHRKRRYLRSDGTDMPRGEHATPSAMRVHGPAKADIGIQREDGSIIWTSVVAAPLPPGSGEYVVVTVDVTERRKVEQALAETVARLEAVLDTAVDGIVTMGEGNRLVLVNAAMTRMFGYTADELIGRSLDSLVSDQAPEAGGPKVVSAGREVVGRRKDGTTIDLHLSVAPLPPCANVGLTIATLHDVSARKAAEAERRLLERRVRESEKLQAIGRLAGGVAHDFSNILTIINVSAELLLARLEPRDPTASEVTTILDAGRRAAALTKQLLTFSRHNTAPRATSDLASVLRHLEPLLRRLLPANIGFAVDARDRLLVGCDASRLEQVAMNLVLNGRDAMPRGGSLRVATRRETVSEAHPRTRPPLQPGPYAVLVVRDTGVGMDQETLDHLFEPFFTTKDLGKGTGLGLATVYAILCEAGGAIEVESTVGAGSSVTAWLPLVEAPPTDADRTRVAPSDVVQPRTILLVEDEPEIRALAARALAEDGHEVLIASDGKAALELARALPRPIHLLLTDVVMPRLNGRVLADLLCRDRPDMKVIFASGYTADVVLEQGVGEGVHLIEKPYSIAVLRKRVRDVLGCPPPDRARS